MKQARWRLQERLEKTRKGCSLYGTVADDQSVRLYSVTDYDPIHWTVHQHAFSLSFSLQLCLPDHALSVCYIKTCFANKVLQTLVTLVITAQTMDRLKIETSNFAGGLRVRDTKQNYKNWAKRGRGQGHVTYFWILAPLLSLDKLKTETSNFAGGLRVKDIKQKIKMG